MDFYLDNLLHLLNMTVVGRQTVEDSILLKLECLNATISCSHCGRTLDTIHQTESALTLFIYSRQIKSESTLSRRKSLLWLSRQGTENGRFNYRPVRVIEEH